MPALASMRHAYSPFMNVDGRLFRCLETVRTASVRAPVGTDLGSEQGWVVEAGRRPESAYWAVPAGGRRGERSTCGATRGRADRLDAGQEGWAAGGAPYA